MTDTALKSWVASANEPGCDFPIQNLPYGVFSVAGGLPRCGVAIGNMIVDLAECEARGLLDAGGTFAKPQLNDFIALGVAKWAETRTTLTALLAEGAEQTLPLVAMAEAQLHAPGYTLRGGTNEILRGIVARGLGLR